MFSILQIQPENKSLLEKLLFFRKKPSVSVEKISMFGSAFNIITAFSKKGKVDFDEVYSAAGKMSRHLIKGENAFLPDGDKRFAFYEPKLYMKKCFITQQ